MNYQRIAQLHRNLSVTHTLIADEFMKAVEPEPTPQPTPQPPTEPTPQPTYNIKIWSGSVQNNTTFQAGVQGNFIVIVEDQQGNPVEGVTVVFPFPDGDRKAKTLSNGGGAVNGYVMNQSIDMVVYVQESPQSTLKWKVNVTGSVSIPTPIPTPTPSPTPEPSEREYSEPPNGSGTQVLVMAIDSKLVDVRLNGKWYDLPKLANVTMSDKPNARGYVFHLHGKLNDIEFDPNQIKVDGLNLWGFGAWVFKLLAFRSNKDLNNLVYNDRDSDQHWTDSFNGIIWGAGGFNSTPKPNPNFTTFPMNPHYSSFNDQNKIGIFIFNHGQNHTLFEPIGDEKW